MTFKNSIVYINQFFFFIFSQLRKIYLNSNIYNKKISKGDIYEFIYKPSPSLLDCIIKYSKKKNDINDFTFNEIWSKKNLKEKDFKTLHNFFWVFTLDLNSSKEKIQSIISNWIELNHKYNDKIWSTDTLSKRIISWISNSKITYENSSSEYKEKFNEQVKKQINHLIYEIDSSKWIYDKMIGCSAIILTGLAYNNKKILDYGLNLLKKIIKFSFDRENFPKSRNIRQLNFYFKYFILIREWLKESQNEVPEYLDETIFYIGQAYSLIHRNNDRTFLFNGNQITNNFEFGSYLKRLGYNFKNENHEVGGYVILRNNKYTLAMDVGNVPEKKFSRDYQSGPLSFELISNKKKVIVNSGYFQNYKHQLNFISKTTASQSTLSVENHSASKFSRSSNGFYEVDNTIKISDKKVFLENNYWSIEASHDGYFKRFGINHHRKLEFIQDKGKLIGKDIIYKKQKYKSTNFEIRFHLEPETKIMQTQDGKTIYIDLENEGWKFTGKNCNVNFETGLYFGKKNNFVENQNIVISGTVDKNKEEISWELEKI